MILAVLAAYLSDTDSTVQAASDAHTCETCIDHPVSGYADDSIQQLADRYSPIVSLKEQESACDKRGEAYFPMAIDLLLDNPDVTFFPTGQTSESLDAPTSADLYTSRRQEDAYLDFPGQPSRPGCGYEERFKALAAGQPGVAYAHVQIEDGKLALQYWFFYYFNDWNNRHEGDWEMIQILFDADSVEEALTRDPIRVAYSQHGSGEIAEWDDDKLEREGTHPIVYISAGSHANYFGPNVHVGIGEGGAGFGCDTTSGESRRLALQARVLPAQVTDPDDPLSWVAYRGHWGERQPGHNNGPTGPIAKPKWNQPLEHFDEGLRTSSMTVPLERTLGPNAIELFCNVISFTAPLVGIFYSAPIVGSILALGLVLLGGGFIASSTRWALFSDLATDRYAAISPQERDQRIVRSPAIRHFLRHLGTFVGIGVLFIPIGILLSLLALVAGSIPGIGALVQFLESAPGLGAIIAALAAASSASVAFMFVSAAVTAALMDVGRGAEPRAMAGYRAVFKRVRSLVRARILTLGAFLLLVIPIVGWVFGVRQIVRWAFVEQAVQLDRASPHEALTASKNAVQGKWWSTFGIVGTLILLGYSTGPIIGIGLLFVFGISPALVNLISSCVYCVMLPLVAIALTQLYILRTRYEPVAESPTANRRQHASTGSTVA